MNRTERRSALLPVAFAVFAAGLLAVVADFGMFAAGYQDLPTWLDVACLLTPAGFGLALVGMVLDARRAARN